MARERGHGRAGESQGYRSAHLLPRLVQARAVIRVAWAAVMMVEKARGIEELLNRIDPVQVLHDNIAGPTSLT